MSLSFFTADPEQVIVPSGFAELDEGFIFEHLKAYCSLFEPIPAITVRIGREGFQLVKGKHYLDIAKELRRHAIRATAFGSGVENVAGFIANVPLAELEQEQDKTVVEGWHVFFLERTASEAELTVIRDLFEAFLARSLPGLIGDFDPKPTDWRTDGHTGFLAIRFPTPVASQIWADEYRRMFQCLPNGLRFISYQGRGLEVPNLPPAVPRG